MLALHRYRISAPHWLLSECRGRSLESAIHCLFDMANDRILVVDDEETIREIVSSMLGGAHFQTRQASSGVEALAILESGKSSIWCFPT